MGATQMLFRQALREVRLVAGVIFLFGGAALLWTLADIARTGEMRHEAEPMTLLAAAALLLMGGAFVTFGAWLALPPLARLRRELRLLRSGAVAECEVLDVFATTTRINRTMFWKLKYRFRDGAGGEHEGESGFLRPEEAARWAPGTRATVRYDRRRPADSLWVGAP